MDFGLSSLTWPVSHFGTWTTANFPTKVSKNQLEFLAVHNSPNSRANFAKESPAQTLGRADGSELHEPVGAVGGPAGEHHLRGDDGGGARGEWGG